MNCFNHPITDAVGTCLDCQKGLCINCASKFSIPLCSPCNMGRVKREKSAIMNELTLTFFAGVIFFILCVFASINLDGPKGILGFFTFLIASLMMFYSGSSIVAGWKQLSTFTSKYFLFMPIVGWIIYFFTKLLIGTLIGYFVLPVRMYKNLTRLNELKQIKTVIVS